MTTAKHCGTSNVLYTGQNGILATCAIGGLYFMTVPLSVLCCLVAIRWSPLMITFHVFGGREKLVELESQGSVWYWSVFFLDWALATAGIYGFSGNAAIFCDTFLKIVLLLRVLR